MSRTKRIYNNPRLKKTQRYNLDEPILHSSGQFRVDRCIGFPFTYRSWICMGKCPQCRDPNREPKLVRKRRKEQFRFDLRNELKKSDKEREHCILPDSILYDATICKLCNDCD